MQGSLCYGYCKSSVSGNVSQTRMKSDYKSVEDQSGLMAGDGGFVVDVKRNTTLTGGVISSSDQAVADGLNLLKTGTLVAEDVKNVARYKADRISVSGGSSGAGTPVALGAFGENDSKTLSGISGGTVEIRDIAGQQALTGKTAAETIALLNRDTSDTLNSLNPIFDKEKIEAGFDIVEEMGNQAGRFFENRAAKAKALKEALKNEPEGPRRDELKAQYEDAKKWEVGGKGRLLATAIIGALSGNVTGGASEIVQAAAVNYLQGLTAQQIKLYADALGDGVEAQAARAAGSVRGDGCGASALGAGAASVVNTLLDAANGKSGSSLSPQEKEARSNLVSSLLAGLAAGLGLDASAVVNSGKLETENNGAATLLMRGGVAAVSACLRVTVCQKEVIGQVAYVAITAAVADLMRKTPGLSEDSALTLAVVQYIVSGGETESIPGKSGDPVPPVGVPPGGGELPDTKLPGKSGDVSDVGVPGKGVEEVDGGEPISTPNEGPIIVDPIFSKNKELQRRAEELGYTRRIPPPKAPFDSHGQVVFWNGKNYITPDVDEHNVSNGWKVVDRRGKRVGTYDKDLNWVRE